MRIAHLADCHIGLGYPGPSPFSRFEDINRILDWAADRLIAEKVDLVLLCGDCFKDAKVMLDRASQEITSILKFLRKLTESRIDVIVISGTPSHDSVAAYELLKDMKIDIEGNCRIHTIPGMRPYHSHNAEEITVACLPGLNRSALLTQEEYKGLPPEQVHRIMTDKITQLCMGMSAQIPSDKTKILMAHMTYQGADKGFDDLLMQHEPILTREAVQGFDLVCLGHIHKPQIIDGKVFYSGPIERLSFNEQDIQPGFWIHEVALQANPVRISLPVVEYKKELNSEFIETPARRYVTLEWPEKAVQGFIDGELQFSRTVVEESIVRLHYSCSEETAQQLNRKQLEQSLYDAGAFFITEIKSDIQRVDRARDNTVNESLSVPQALEKWAVNQGIEAQEVEALKAMAVGLLEQPSC